MEQPARKSARISASSSASKENSGRTDPSPALVHKQPARSERPIPLSPNGAKAPHSEQPMHMQIDPPPHAATPAPPAATTTVSPLPMQASDGSSPTHASDGPQTLSLPELADLCDDGEEEEEEEPDLEVLTLPKLKELLKLCDQPVSGKKEALVERLTDHGNEASRARAREMIAEIERTAAGLAV
jgi:hypothetical protein